MMAASAMHALRPNGLLDIFSEATDLESTLPPTMLDLGAGRNFLDHDDDIDMDLPDSLDVSASAKETRTAPAFTSSAADLMHDTSSVEMTLILESQVASMTNGSSTGARSSSFVRTSLLDDDDDDVDALETTTARLAGETSLDRTLLTSTNLLDVEVGALSEGSTSRGPSFVANGLLGDPDAGPSIRNLADDLMDSDSQELPSISALLGISPRWGPATGTTYANRTVRFARRTKGKSKTALRRNEKDHLQLLERPIHRLMEDLAIAAVQPAAQTNDVHVPAVVQRHLWVDRYRPKRFLDLLGDDRVHRETMSWLKEWDHCVFGRKNGKKRARETDPGIEGYEDPFHRPYEKILLLSGPPGLGKTTLAHVIATAAGYSVYEINASDDRGGRVVDDRIRPALEAGSGVGSKKPVCVVIDEIDGVGGASGDSNTFITSLIQLTLDKARKKGSGRRGQDVRPLLRPIICICNDLYAPSLRSLRQYARLVRLRAPTPLVLTNRLRDVCELEGLKADNRALSALVGVTKGDIRSCLNTLQFIQSRTAEVTEAIVRSATIGLKDSELSTQQVWDDIFRPPTKKRIRQLGLTDGEESRYVSRLNFEVEATDEVERVMQGCFYHYPKARLRDSPWVIFEKAHEWLDAFSLFTGTFKGGDDPIYALREYRSYFVVAFSPLFTNPGNPKAEFPQADYEAFLTAKANEEIYSTFAKQLSADVTKSFTQDLFPTELLPFLNRLISPALRTVNNQVVKADERAILNKLVQTMADMKLRFVQEKTEEGQLVYRLDPPIDVFITYDGKRSSDVGASRYALRQVVAQQVDAELERRAANVVERGQAARTASFFGGKAGPIQGVDIMPRSHDQAPVDPSEKPPLDFFGRPLTLAAKAKHTAAKAHSSRGNISDAIQKFRVAYKFHEGNSAAVRRPIKVSSLL